MSVDTARVFPWSTDTPDLLTRSLTHTATARIVLPSGEEIPLTLIGGTVEYDETRAPYVSARSLVCQVPDDQATLDRVDPRTGARLLIDAGYVRPDGLTDLQPLVNLGLRTRRVNRPEDTMTLEAASDEALVIDNAGGTGGSVVEATTLAGILTTVRLIFPGVAFDTTGTSAGPALNQSPMGDKWELVNDLSDQLDARTYDDGLRNWNVKPAAVLTTPALELAVGTNGTVLASDTALTRDDGFANRVLLTYDWTDSSDVQHLVNGVRSITSGPYLAATGNIKLLTLTRRVPATSTQATNAAAALVKRTVTRGRSFSLQAVSAYWLRPRMTVTVDLPLGDPEDHLVTAVAFDLETGLMTVKTRLPDGTYTIGA